MKKLLTLCFLVIALPTIYAQQIFEVPENTPVNNNDLDYGYLITNEKNKSVKGEDYDRFEIELYISNKSNCMKLYPLRTNNLGQLADNSLYTLAEFTIKNATAKRLTAKSGKIEAQPLYAIVHVNNNTQTNNTSNGLQQALVGYAIKPGQSLSKKIIVIVPKGERPIMNCKTNYLPEMQ